MTTKNLKDDPCGGAGYVLTSPAMPDLTFNPRRYEARRRARPKGAPLLPPASKLYRSPCPGPCTVPVVDVDDLGAL